MTIAPSTPRQHSPLAEGLLAHRIHSRCPLESEGQAENPQIDQHLSTEADRINGSAASAISFGPFGTPMDRANTHHIDWVLAVVEGLTRPPTDGVVWKSWIRSANAHGVDPGSRESPRILTVSELRVSREALSQLIEVARAELDHLYKIVRPARYVILLCDKDGMVIEHRGEESEAAQFRRWGTWLGGVWSEERRNERHWNMPCRWATGDRSSLTALSGSAYQSQLLRRPHLRWQWRAPWRVGCFVHRSGVVGTCSRFDRSAHHSNSARNRGAFVPKTIPPRVDHRSRTSR